MKHIKKKYLKSSNINFNVDEFFKTLPIDHDALSRLHKTNYSTHYPVAFTENEAIQCFVYERSFKPTLFIPEPNPITIYFHIAQLQLNNLYQTNAELISELEKADRDLGKILNSSYNFFSHSSICAVFLFNAIEAFVNLMIPESYKYEIDTGKKTEVYNKAQIQENIKFQDKIKNIIPGIKGKPFHQDHAHKFDGIIRLKNLRDEISHTKTHLESKPNWYKNLYIAMLGFDFRRAIHYVKDYINYYEPDLIEECNCGKNY